MNIRWTTLLVLVLATVLSARAVTAPPLRTPEERRQEIAAKEERLRAFLRSSNYDGVLIGTQRNFAWLTAGGDSHVVFNAEEGSALLLWLPDRKHVVVSNNEVARITREELAGLGYEPSTFVWHEDSATGERARRVRELIGGRRIASDINLPGAGVENVEGQLASLRYKLTEAELTRYRWLARAAAEVVESVARETRLGQTESAIQAEVAGRLMRWDILPTVLLVAADDRIADYKHPVTKDKPVQREVMITLCARKWGLVVAVTRHLYRGALPAAVRDRQEALGGILAAMASAHPPRRNQRRGHRRGAPGVFVFRIREAVGCASSRRRDRVSGT